MGLVQAGFNGSAPLVFSGLAPTDKAIDLSGAGIGNNGYFIYKDANNYWRGNGSLVGNAIFGISVVYCNDFVARSAVDVTIRGGIPDGANAIAISFTSTNALVTAGAKIASFYSDVKTTERAYIDKDGYIGINQTPVAASGVASTHKVKIILNGTDYYMLLTDVL